MCCVSMLLRGQDFFFDAFNELEREQTEESSSL